jgi:hypothetical protein
MEKESLDYLAMVRQRTAGDRLAAGWGDEGSIRPCCCATARRMVHSGCRGRRLAKILEGLSP